MFPKEGLFAALSGSGSLLQLSLPPDTTLSPSWHKSLLIFSYNYRKSFDHFFIYILF